VMKGTHSGNFFKPATTEHFSKTNKKKKQKNN
jgi:hypothetical protein